MFSFFFNDCVLALAEAQNNGKYELVLLLPWLLLRVARMEIGWNQENNKLLHDETWNNWPILQVMFSKVRDQWSKITRIMHGESKKPMNPLQKKKDSSVPSYNLAGSQRGLGLQGSGPKNAGL